MSGPWVVAFVALWALVVMVALLVLGTLRRLTPILANVESMLAMAGTTARASGLDVGAFVPAFAAETTKGEILTDDDLAASPTVVLFVDASCRACDSIVAGLEAGRPVMPGIRLVVVGEQMGEGRQLTADPDVTVVQAGSALAMASAFASERTPEAFVIIDGRVAAKGLTSDLDQLLRLVSRADTLART
jgi:hypothetical protein